MPKTKGKAAPVVEELDDLEDAFEELDDETPAPTTKAKKATVKTDSAGGAEKPEFDTNWMATQVAEVTGEPCDGRTVRMVLRKMAKNGELERVVGEDRTRYSFPKGLNDPTVKAVLKLARTGGLAPVKREEAIKEAKERKAKKAEVEADLPEELEAPKPKAKKAPAEAAPPAKAQPSSKRARVRA